MSLHRHSLCLSRSAMLVLTCAVAFTVMFSAPISAHGKQAEFTEMEKKWLETLQGNDEKECIGRSVRMAAALNLIAGRNKTAREFLQTPKGQFLAAVSSSDIETAKRLIISGVDIHATDKRRGYEGNNALHHAVRFNNIPMAQLLVGSGMDVDETGKRSLWDVSPLLVAVGLGRTQMVRFLIENGANIYRKSPNWGTPLEHAIRRGSLASFDLLMAAGYGTPEKRSYLAKSFVYLTLANDSRVCKTHYRILERLLEAGVDPMGNPYGHGRNPKFDDLVGKSDGFAMILAKRAPSIDWTIRVHLRRVASPLVPAIRAVACQTKQNAVLRYLLEVHPRKNLHRAALEDATGSALHCFATSKDNVIERTDYVLGLGLDVNSRDQEGKTPIFRANAYAILRLLEQGADVNAVDKDGQNALFDIVRTVYERAVGERERFKRLIEAGIEVNHRDNEGKTALHRAAKYGDEDWILALVKSGADVNIADNNGDAPLHTDSLSDLSYLLEAGASPHAKNHQGRTPLSFVRSVDTARQLVEHGANVNEQDNEGMTPISHLKDPRVVEYLLNRGAALDIADFSGKLPIHHAASHSASYARFLVKHGSKVDPVDNDGNTPLHLTVLEDNPYVATELLQLGADPGKVNLQGLTPADLLAQEMRRERGNIYEQNIFEQRWRNVHLESAAKTGASSGK